MSEQFRVITGYDCEFLIGGNYFTQVFRALYVSGGFLNRKTLDNPAIQMLLSGFGARIDGYTIKLKGTLAKDSFSRIAGMDSGKSRIVHNYLDSRDWLSNDTLVDGFDPQEAGLQVYLSSTFPEASQAITEHLQCAMRTANLTIDEPYKTVLFDDDLPLRDILSNVLVTIREYDVDLFVGFMETKNFLDDNGKVAVDFDTLRWDVTDWLYDFLPTHKLGFMASLRSAISSGVVLRDRLLADLVPLTKFKLDKLLAFMKGNSWLTPGGRFRESVDEIEDTLRPWLAAELPMIEEDILLALRAPPDIAIHIAINLAGTHTYANGEVRELGDEVNEIILFMPFTFDAKAIQLGTPIIAQESVKVLNVFCAQVEKFGLGTQLCTLIAGLIPEYFELGMVPSRSVIHINYKRLNSSGSHPSAYGIYCNIDLDLRALPVDFDMEQYNKPPNVVGERITVDKDGYLAILGKDGEAIDAARFVYSVNDPATHADTLPYFVVGNVALSAIKLDDTGHLVVELKSGKTLSPDELVELAKRNLPRGNLNKAVNFLGHDQDFAIGVGESILRRYEKSLWNSFYVPFPEGIPDVVSNMVGQGTRPMRDAAGAQIGTFEDIDMDWRDGAIQCVVKGTFFVDLFLLPDADIYCRVAIRPNIKDYHLTLDTEVEELNADTGLLGDLISFIVGILTMGPYGILLVPALEIAESSMADQQKPEVQAMLNEKTNLLFNTIPKVIELFRKSGEDIAYYIAYGPSQLYEAASINTKGMVLGGKSGIGNVNHPLPVKLVGRTRHAVTTDLLDLIYRDDSGHEANIAANIAKFRIQNLSLTRVTLNPTAQHRKEGRIHSLRFDSGIDLRIPETIQLMRDWVIHVPRVRVHTTKSGREYLRTKQDSFEGNNLSELPDFKPTDMG